MQSPRAALALALSLALLPQRSSPELHILRTSPEDGASPASEITVTFDRPVAGSLDYTVPADSIIVVSPAIAGHIEWRDPVTVRLRPRAFLSPNVTYTVTVRGDFRAMDGARLAKPYTFSFHVQGPMLLTGSPASPETGAEHLKEDSRFEVVYSAPVDTARLAAASLIHFNAPCAGTPTIRLRVLGQREIDDKDHWQYRAAGG